MATVNKTRYALLGLLTLAPMCGYEMKKYSERSLKYFWSESYGQIYPMLSRMKAEGLVTAQKDQQEGRPGRIVYSITDKGREVLRDWMQTPIEPTKPRIELLLRLFFGPEIQATHHMDNIRGFKEARIQLLREYEKIAESIKTLDKGDPRTPYKLMTLSLGRHVARAMSEWCDESLAILEEQRETP